MKNAGLWGIAAVLAAVIAICFVWPQAMVAPGPVIAAHAAIAQDCFACHAPLRGASAARCIACHAPARIGRFTTRGVPLRAAGVAFHQQLQQPDCLACHTDHAGPALTGHSPVAFQHSLLQPAVQDRCASCHAAPTGPRLGGLHSSFAAANCSNCHTTSSWKSARFDHALLSAKARGACVTCHARPSGALHRGFGTVNCAQCHATSAWEPARFAHDRWFRLDRNHDVSCATCHVGSNTARYTCYGCHEHQPAQIIAEHRAEGLRNIDNCVRCHRSADGEGGEGGEGDDD
ncbi:MAG: cytochrome c3 family protein [Polymorphobacter sp.]